MFICSSLDGNALHILALGNKVVLNTDSRPSFLSNTCFQFSRVSTRGRTVGLYGHFSVYVLRNCRERFKEQFLPSGSTGLH